MPQSLSQSTVLDQKKFLLRASFHSFVPGPPKPMGGPAALMQVTVQCLFNFGVKFMVFVTLYSTS